MEFALLSSKLAGWWEEEGLCIAMRWWWWWWVFPVLLNRIRNVVGDQWIAVLFRLFVCLFVWFVVEKEDKCIIVWYCRRIFACFIAVCI
jgi:hypothetical protein